MSCVGGWTSCCFSCCYDKIPNKGNVRKEELILACMSIRETQRQEHEVTGHNATTVRKQGRLCCFLLCYSV